MLQTLARGSRRGALGLVAGLVALTLLVQPVAGQATRQLDQQQTAQTTAAGITNVNDFFQTFMAGLTGSLDQVDLALAQAGLVGVSTFTIEIRTVEAGGVPGPTVLASTTQSVSSLPVLTGPAVLPFTSYSLTPGAPVVAGTQYAIHVSSTVPPGSLVSVAATGGDLYPGGQIFQDFPLGTLTSFPAFDFVYRTFVTPPVLSVGNAQVAEGNSGTTTLIFPVTLSIQAEERSAPVATLARIGLRPVGPRGTKGVAHPRLRDGGRAS
jgi:hypothetical protein